MRVQPQSQSNTSSIKAMELGEVTAATKNGRGGEYIRSGHHRRDSNKCSRSYRSIRNDYGYCSFHDISGSKRREEDKEARRSDRRQRCHQDCYYYYYYYYYDTEGEDHEGQQVCCNQEEEEATAVNIRRRSSRSYVGSVPTRRRRMLRR